MRKNIIAIVGLLCASPLFWACNKQSETDAAQVESKAEATDAVGDKTTYTNQSGGQNANDKGKEIGYVYEAYLSPQQEGGEEEDTPKGTPSQFKSTAPSRDRDDRKEHGHGKISFTRDLSKAIIEVEVADLKIEDINMFHIHCGRPGQLGPILVDFALITDIQKNFNDDGILALEVTNKDIEAEAASGEGIIGAFTAGCPIVPGGKEKVKTIAGMEYIAREGDLYFNLHTKGQTYFGDMRGQVHPEFDKNDPIETKVAPQDAPAPVAGATGHMH